ncbi:DUF1015 domain-containing protein [Ruficoccus amylovorans]|uniref:DUF1015 domain-containing protein n=1 Tax=Ruficoccus amylovorans TaxID=1804625 RepID=A0A842HCS0_9BACT|nr:DUF1015 family protein [Ruficoccus amylovorans]MBC2593397.1 DUF1015 domain-containing protein [Ruficoccus amylovorans]
MRIRAFQGLRPTPESAPKIASLPYDVVNTAEARALAEGNPLSFLHVVRAEIDLPDGTDPYSPDVYAQAKAALTRLEAEGGLVRESEPCLYLYRQQMGEHVQTGVVGVFHIEDYENDLIKKHEKTRKAKEDDRTTLNRTLSAHPGPVFLTYKEEKAIDEAVARISAEKPFVSFTAPDGVVHTVWRIPGGSELVEAFKAVPVTYVADGHHRSASAARVGKERRDANPAHTGEEDYNWFLAVIFPGNQLNVLPYNRYVHSLNGHTPESLLAAIGKVCTVTEGASPEPASYGDVSMYLDGKWYGLKFPGGEADPIARLDVSRLQDHVLAPLLDIDDPRTSEKIDFIGGIRGTKELVKLVDNDGGVAFSLYPVTVDQLIDIADAGAIMPPKSTWFEPKLRSGLFIHTF